MCARACVFACVDARGANDGPRGRLFHRYRIVRISAQLDHPNSNDPYPQEAKKNVLVRPLDNGMHKNSWITYISPPSEYGNAMRFFRIFMCILVCPVV